MNPSEYQKAAMRTECDQARSLMRIGHESAPDGSRPPMAAVRAIHAMIGVQAEAGEVAGLVQKWLYYSRDPDYNKMYEELGDLMWYVAQICDALGFDLGDVMATNIVKLRTRFPEKFTDEACTNRDLAKEAMAVAHSGPQTIGSVMAIQAAQTALGPLPSERERLDALGEGPNYRRAGEMGTVGVLLTPHASHHWTTADGPDGICIDCGAARESSAGVSPCLGYKTEQNGHGWAEPPAGEH